MLITHRSTRSENPITWCFFKFFFYEENNHSFWLPASHFWVLQYAGCSHGERNRWHPGTTKRQLLLLIIQWWYFHSRDNLLTVYRKNEGKVLTEDEIKAKIEYCYMGVDKHQLNRKQWCHSDQGPIQLWPVMGRTEWRSWQMNSYWSKTWCNSWFS